MSDVYSHLVTPEYSQGDHWDEFVERLNVYFSANEVIDEDKVNILITTIDAPTYSLVSQEISSAKNYAELVNTVSKRKAIRRNQIFEQFNEQFKFQSAKRIEGISKVQGPKNSIMSQLYSLPVTHKAISEAANRIAEFCHITPMMTSSEINKRTGKSLYFKTELFQKTGSFKYRGTMNAVLKLKDHVKDRIESKKGIVLVTRSSGNHGMAVSLAAKQHGFKAVVVVPSNTSQFKVDGINRYESEVVLCDPSRKGAVMACQKIIDDIGESAEYIPSGDHPLIICGQGTIALEMLQQVPDLDALLVSVGSGSLLSGIAVVAKAIQPSIKVYGAEPELSNATSLSFAVKERISFCGETPKTVADGLRGNVGALPWQLINNLVDGFITVSEEEIIDAMKLSWYQMKLTIESSAACSLAAVDQQKSNLLKDHHKIGIVLCGGNVDLNTLPWVGSE